MKDSKLATKEQMEAAFNEFWEKYQNIRPKAASLPERLAQQSSLDGIGSLIKRLRVEQNISQRELATLAGLSIGPVRQLEEGLKSTSLENTERILKVLGKSLIIK